LSLTKGGWSDVAHTTTDFLTCHPDTMTFLEDNIEKLKEANQGIRFILLKDENLEKNGCTIENESQIIDLQIGKQINSIIEDLRNMEV
jgi:flagellar assembly protein FliH